MRKKVVLLLLVGVLSSSVLTGCTNEEIDELNSISALNTESNVSTLKLSASDEEAAIYAQVSDRTLLDLTTLEKVDKTDEQAVISYMESVDAQLCGTLSSSEGVIEDYYTDYLLMEFEKTPYFWQRSEMNIRGMDAKSRSIIVDITYRTIDYEKDVQGSSYIALGEPNYEQKMQVRFERWLGILSQKYGYSNTSWESDYNQFVSVYGEPADIIEAQKATSLTTRIYEKGIQGTYNGLVDSEEEKSHATMVVRYILVPQYTLGINQGFNCEHMYLLSYALSDDPTDGRELYNEEGSAKIVDSVYELIYSIHQSEDEDNYLGLYSLIHSFESLDKYYNDLFDTSYRKHDNFTISLFDVSGTTIECGVTVSAKVRAKGSNMTMPIYKQRWYYVIELIDGKLQVTNAVLLSSELEGEPTINTEEIETTGFTSKIVLDNEDKRSLENLIANFGTLQLLGDTSSDKFSEVVDTSISTSQMSILKESMASISGATRVTWISSYLQGQSNYASIKCKELFQKSDNSITEATVTYEFINKGNKWYVYSYTVNSSAKLDTTDLATKGSLCIVVPGEVKDMHSQVVTTGGNTENSAEAGIVGTITKYEVYEPVAKTGVQETGLAVYNSGNLTEEDFKLALENIFTMSNFTDYTADDVVSTYSTAPIELQDSWKSLISAYLNYTNNYINQTEYSYTVSDLDKKYKDDSDSLRALAETQEEKDSILKLSQMFSRVKSLLP